MTTSAPPRSRRRRRQSGDDETIAGLARRWWPLGPFILSGLLIALATALDAGDSSHRDAALLIGSVALYIVLPLAVLTALTVMIVRQRLRRLR